MIVRESPRKEGGPRVPEEKTVSKLSVLDVATRRVYLDLVGFQGCQLPAHQNITTITEESVDIKQSFDYAVRESITFADLVVSLKV